MVTVTEASLADRTALVSLLAEMSGYYSERGNVAALAAATHAPGVPVATDSGLRWGRRAFRKQAGTIHVSVLDPLPAGLPRAALMAALEAAIETETDRLLGLRGPVENSGETGPVISDSARQRGTPTP